MQKGIVRWGLVFGLVYAIVGSLLLFLYEQNSVSDFVASVYSTLYYPTWLCFHVFLVKVFSFSYYQYPILGSALDALFEFVIGAVVGGLSYLVFSLIRRK